MTTVWGDTDGCEKQYMCALYIYLMTVLSYLYGIVMDCEINAPGHGNSVQNGFNDTEIVFEVTNGTSW